MNLQPRRQSLYPWFCSALALAAAPSADGYGTSPHAAVIPTPRAETQGKRKAPALLELWQGIGLFTGPIAQYPRGRGQL